MNEQLSFPELNCKYDYHGATISISQIAQHEGKWSFELFVCETVGSAVEEAQVQATPYLDVDSETEALKVAKTFAEDYVDSKR